MQQLDLLLENLAANRQLQEYDNFEEEVVEEYTPSYETNMRPDGCAEDHKGIQLQHYNIIYPSTTAINNTTSLPATTNTKQPSDGGTDKDEFFSAIESQDCEEGEFEEENDGDEDEEDEDGNDDVFMTTTTASSTAATSSSAKKKKKKKKKSKKTKKNKMDSQTSAMALSSTLLTSASSSSSNYSLSAIPSTSTNTKSLVASMLVMDALSLVEDDDENSSSQGTEPDQSSFMSSSKRLSFNNIGGLSDDRKDSKLDLEIDVPRDSDSSGKQRPLQQQQQYKNLLQQQQQLYIDPFPSGKFELSVSSRLPVILYPLVIDEIMRMSNDVMIVSMYR